MPTDTRRTPAGSALAAALRGSVAGLLLGVGVHFGFVLLGSNFRTAAPGRVYRCAQPSPAALERFVRRHAVRTVINLRGSCVNADWYRAQARVTARLDIAQEDVFLSASRLPSTVALRHLVEVLERAEYPVLIHCHQGADRTGLAVVAYFLLCTDATLDDALRHLGPASGHVPLGRTRHMDRFFRLYRRWLADRGQEHTSAVFRDWALHHYCPGVGRAELTLLEAPAGRLQLRAGQAAVCTLRCRNTSERPWHFRAAANAGVHAWITLFDHNDRLVAQDRAGLFDARVDPGGRIELTVPVMALPPGRYQLRIDLADEQHAWFVQLGGEMLCVDVEVS